MLVPGFFHGRRRPANIVSVGASAGLSEYENLPRIIGVIVSSGKATLRELQTHYSVEDAYNLAEVIAVDGSNQHRMMERAQRKQGR